MSLSASDVSVIIVNWNGRGHLATCLPSVLALDPGEVIVVDNGSHDGSVEFVASRFPSVRILRNPVNRGFAQPNNLAAREAKGSVLALLNNDMRCHPEWLRAGLATLEQTDCAASRILNWEGDRIDYNGASLQYLGFALQRDIGELAASVQNRDRVLFPCGGAMLVHRSVFLDLGGFDEDFFALFEDVDFGWRLWVTGHEVRLSNDSLVYHRGHGTFREQAAARMRYLMHRNCMLTVLKNYDDVTLRKVFPVAVLMAVKRAVRLSGIRKESLYLWSDTKQGLTEGNPSVREALEDSFNHLAALDDVVAMLPTVLEKRAAIQARRRRQDSEILALFEDPLRPIVEDPDYILQEAELLTLLGLDTFFPVADYRKLASNLTDPALEKLRRVRDELRSLEWVTTQALLHPPPLLRRSRLEKLKDSFRSLGWRATARMLWRRLRHGD